MQPEQHSFDTVVVWFRRDLRIDDNTALAEACARAKSVVPLFVLDDAILQRGDTGAARVIFLLDALRHLDEGLRKRGGRLVFRHGETPDEILRVMKESGADALFFNRDYEPFARARDARVIEEARRAGKAAVSFKDLVLFEPEEIKSNGGSHYTVFSPFKRVWFNLPSDAPRKAPQSLHVPKAVSGEAIPTAEALRFSSAQKFDCGGEHEARRLLDRFVASRLPGYEADRNDMALDATSRLSRHLKFGTLGIRTAVHAAMGKPGAESWLSELAWRDFYTQVLWFYPHVEKRPLRPQFEKLAWRNSESDFMAWCEGRTGYPVVDAAMRQMNTEAWMHNRARMIVASFLCKDLLINWQEGEKYFMQMLVDGDLAQNNGGWQWTAGTGTDPQPYFRIFNPVSQGEKFDPKGDYVRRWVPELAHVQDKWIHAPWLMSPVEQEAARCRIGVDYPAPIVDHACQRAITLDVYKRAAASQPTEPRAEPPAYSR